MPTEYVECDSSDPSVRELLDELIETYRPDLKHVKIGLLFAHADKPGPGKYALKVRGRSAAGSCKVNAIKDRVDGKPDATITLDGDRWAKFPERSRRALLHHEVEHIGPGANRSRPGDWDFDGFHSILKIYGESSFELKNLRLISELHLQMELPFSAGKAEVANDTPPAGNPAVEPDTRIFVVLSKPEGRWAYGIRAKSLEEAEDWNREYHPGDRDLPVVEMIATATPPTPIFDIAMIRAAQARAEMPPEPEKVKRPRKPKGKPPVIEPDLERMLEAESDNDADDQVDPRDLYQIVHEPTIGQWLKCHVCNGNYDHPAPVVRNGKCHRSNKEVHAIRELHAELDLDWHDAPMWELDLTRTEVEAFEEEDKVTTVGELCDQIETHGWAYPTQEKDRVLTAIIHFKEQIERNARKAMEAKAKAEKPKAKTKARAKAGSEARP